MAKAEIFSGICGFVTTVIATLQDDDQRVVLTIEGECPGVQQLAAELPEVNVFQEIAYQGEGPRTLLLAAKYLRHTACPVPAGIIKGVEVAAGLALPADAAIKLSK